MRIRAIIDGKEIFGQYLFSEGVHYIVIPENEILWREERYEISGIIEITALHLCAIETGKDAKNGHIFASKDQMRGGDMVNIYGKDNKAEVIWAENQQTWSIWGNCLCGFASENLNIIPRITTDVY